jgi:hypothetical protein
MVKEVAQILRKDARLALNVLWEPEVAGWAIKFALLLGTLMLIRYLAHGSL